MYGYNVHEPSTKIVISMATGSRDLALGKGQYCHIVQCLKIFKNLFFYSYLYLRRTECMVMMSIDNVLIVKIMAPGSKA